MNVVILSVKPRTADPSGRLGELAKDLEGGVGYIPWIKAGSDFFLYQSNAQNLLFSDMVIRHMASDQQPIIHRLMTPTFELALLQVDEEPPRKKRIGSHMYLCRPIGQRISGKHYIPDGTLLAQGKYRTKIFASDLPSWFVFGALYGQEGFISAQGVKDLLYRPNYIAENNCENDLLLISYGDKIEETVSSEGFSWYKNYDYAISGSLIFDFVIAVNTYSDIDTADILAEMERKKRYDSRASIGADPVQGFGTVFPE